MTAIPLPTSAQTPARSSRTRGVPWALRARLIANVVVIAGASMLAIALIAGKFALPFEQARSKWLLASDPRPVQGIVETVNDIKFAVAQQPVHRFDYRYALPDGKMHLGHSYSRRARPAPGELVTVEYAAADPTISHIQGMAMTVVPGWAPMLPMMAGALIMVGGLLWALNRLRLLQRGEVVMARMRTCKVLDRKKQSTELPFDQFRQQFIPADASAAGAIGTPRRQFMTPWTWVAFTLTIFGALFILAALYVGARGGNKGTAVFGGFFFVAWLLIGTSAVSAGRRVPSARRSLLDRLRVACSFEFVTAEGETVAARSEIQDGTRLEDSRPDEPVIYRAKSPRKALLVRALPLPVSVTSDGRLELTGGAEVGLARLALLIFLLLAPAIFYFTA